MIDDASKAFKKGGGLSRWAIDCFGGFGGDVINVQTVYFSGFWCARKLGLGLGSRRIFYWGGGVGSRVYGDHVQCRR